MKDLKRIQKTLELFKVKKQVTTEEWQNALGEPGEPLSYETINRLRKKLTEKLNIPIEYSRKDSAYIIAEGNELEENINVLTLSKFLENYEIIDCLAKHANKNIEVLHFIEFEKQTELKHFNFFDDLLLAMKQQLEILITYKSFYATQEKSATVRPLYIKQYQNRWYLIAEANNTFKSYGLDRLKTVTLTEKTFEAKTEKAKELFSQVVGLNHSDSDRQRIVMEFVNEQKPYVTSLPFHHTQKIIKEDIHKFQIEIWVRPNYELQQQIQKFGNLVEVLEGDWIYI